jgi:hypothetical protein
MKNVGEVRGCRLLQEETGRHGEARKDVENDGELESKEAEETRDIGEVDEKDVVREACPDRVIRRRGLSLWGPSSGRSLLENPSDGSRRDSKSGSGDGLGDTFVASEAEKTHRVDELPYDVGVAADGRGGADEGTSHRWVVSSGFALPTCDGLCGNAKTACGLVLGPSEELLEAKDAKAVLRRELRPFSVGDLVPSGSEELGDFLRAVCE